MTMNFLISLSDLEVPRGKLLESVAHPYLLPNESFITNFDLVIESSNRKLEDYETLFEVDLADYDVIKMVPCNYNKTDSDFHLNRLKYILHECPPAYNKANCKIF